MPRRVVVSSIHFFLVNRGHKRSILALNTHRNLLFSAGGDHVIKVWNLEELAHGCKHTMSGHTDKVSL